MVLVRDHPLPSVNFTKRKRGAKPGDKCLFPHHKVDEQPSKKPKKRASTLKTKEGDDKAAVDIMQTAPHASCKTLSHHELNEACSTGETRGKKIRDQLDDYDSHSPRYVKQVSWKRKDHRLEKYKSKFLISEVPAL